MYSSDTVTGRGRVAARLPSWALGEHRLARMAARGETGAFEALFARYHRELYNYCRAILGEPEEANDALQNTMAVAIRHLPGIERRRSLRGWLYRVAHNEAITILRRRPLPLDPVELPEKTGPSAEATFEERERVRELVADLRQLPDRQRGALVMRELSGLSYSQIAAAMDTSEAGARQLVYEARESLRALEVGRNLECESARRSISERDGRVLRGRRLRAHLAVCSSCRDYRTAIDTRRSDLAALFPPLAPVGALGLLGSLLASIGKGSSGASEAVGTAALGGGGGAALGGVGIKAASIVSVVALGAGAAGLSGGVKPFGNSGDQEAAKAAMSSPAVGSATHRHAPTDIATTPARPGHSPGSSRANGNRYKSTLADEPGRGGGSSNAHSNPSPGTPPAKVQSGGPPASPPGLSDSSHPTPPSDSSAGGDPPAAADQGLGQAATVQAQTRGNSAAAPGQASVPAPQAAGNPNPPDQGSR
jgi:RNA polymerase sigma factor (sigma-70 family)